MKPEGNPQPFSNNTRLEGKKMVFPSFLLLLSEPGWGRGAQLCLGMWHSGAATWVGFFPVPAPGWHCAGKGHCCGSVGHPEPPGWQFWSVSRCLNEPFSVKDPQRGFSIQDSHPQFHPISQSQPHPIHGGHSCIPCRIHIPAPPIPAQTLQPKAMPAHPATAVRR